MSTLKGVALLALALSACAVPDVTTQPIPTSQYEVRILEGWTVYVNRILLREQHALGAGALKVLGAKLYELALAEWEEACRLDPANRLYQTNLKRLRAQIAARVHSHPTETE